MKKKKLTLIVAAVLTAASLSVPRADAAWCWNEHAACGGESMCCVIFLKFCYAWDCSI